MAQKRIGIIGGVGPSATVLYYQQIIEGFHDRTGGSHFPEIFVHSLDLGEVNTYFNNQDLDLLSDKLVQVMEGLEKIGCDFAILACNAMHMVFDDLRQRVNMPMISIVEAVLEEIRQRQLKKVGIMGTTFVMQGGLYRRPLELSGVECFLPDEDEQAWIMKAILQDLQHSNIPEATVSRLMKDVESLGAQGAEEVILACTDLPVAIKETQSTIPLLDTTKLHVRAILDFAFGKVK
jgi:aspartate racemase